MHFKRPYLNEYRFKLVDSFSGVNLNELGHRVLFLNHLRQNSCAPAHCQSFRSTCCMHISLKYYPKSIILFLKLKFIKLDFHKIWNHAKMWRFRGVTIKNKNMVQSVQQSQNSVCMFKISYLSQK